MNKTSLQLLYLDSPDPKFIYLQDISWYNPDVAKDNPTLIITPPNFSTSYAINYSPNSLIPISSNAFGWTTANCPEELTTLQDGAWIIDHSVCNATPVTTTHFRIVNLKSKIMDYVSKQLDINNKGCNINSAWYTDVFKLLQLLDQAKYMAENCGLCDQAVIIYNQVEIQAAQLDCQC